MSRATPKRLSPAKRFVGVRILPWFVLILGVFGLYVGVEDIVEARATTRWPTVEGTVVRSSLGTPDQYYSGDTKVVADVTYEYVVDGTTLTGTGIAFNDFATNDLTVIQDILDRYPAGRAVTVYYRPDNPQQSLLEPGVRALSFVMPVMGLLTTIAGLVLVVFAPKLVPPAR